MPLTQFSTMLCTHLSKLSSSPVILLTDFAPDAFDSDDLPSSVLPDNGLLKPVVPDRFKTKCCCYYFHFQQI